MFYNYLSVGVLEYISVCMVSFSPMFCNPPNSLATPLGRAWHRPLPCLRVPSPLACSAPSRSQATQPRTSSFPPASSAASVLCSPLHYRAFPLSIPQHASLRGSMSAPTHASSSLSCPSPPRQPDPFCEHSVMPPTLSAASASSAAPDPFPLSRGETPPSLLCIFMGV